jgi:predicted nucleotidyltransferase
LSRSNNKPPLASLLDRSPQLLLRAVAGSHAYGTNHAHSDIDLRGIFMLPREAYLVLGKPLEQINDDKNDIVFYTFKRFLELASIANPNIIELLYMPDDCVQFAAPEFELVKAQRQHFVTKQAYQSHIGYAQAQIKKAKGRNKWINNPQPKELPDIAQFCYVIADSLPDLTYPYRSMPLLQTGIDPSHCRLASVDHAPGLYRLYRFEEPDAGIFKGGKVFCSSIAETEEHTHCVGLFYFNKEAFEQAKRNHANYWKWMKERNSERWKLQEGGQLDYDSKNMMHCFRLLISGEQILSQGEPLVRFEGELLQLLTQIRAGEFSYQELIDQLEVRMMKLEQAWQNTTMPDSVDPEWLDTLFREVTAVWEQRVGSYLK